MKFFESHINSLDDSVHFPLHCTDNSVCGPAELVCVGLGDTVRGLANKVLDWVTSW